MTLSERFDKFRDECDSLDSFQNIVNKRSKREDLHAFLLLDELIPSKQDIVLYTDHYGVYLSVEPDELNEVITDGQVKELLCCGVFIQNSCLYMFV